MQEQNDFLFISSGEPDWALTPAHAELSRLR